MRHDCSKAVNGKYWHICPICDGRIHDDGCTTKRNPKKDCCPERHKMLHDAGNTKGLNDSSYFMWSEDHPEGYHPNDVKRKDA